jgi:hypothetical protein
LESDGPDHRAPRDLHIEEALACINFGDQTICGEERTHVGSVWTMVTRLVTCDSFIIERVRMIEGYDGEIPYEQLVVWMVLDGEGEIIPADGGPPIPFGRGGHGGPAGWSERCPVADAGRLPLARDHPAGVSLVPFLRRSFVF